MRTFTSILLSAALVLVLVPSATAQSVGGLDYTATANCGSTPTGHVSWPASDPVWEFDFIQPAQSSGERGSGLEIRNAYYNGNLVFRAAHVPILNVEYDSGGCGCYRDWQYSQTGYATDGIRTGGESCVADATAGAVITTCESNENGGEGGNPGSFTGIAIEDFGSELVLTGNMSAGWYRYRMKWHFYADGRIWPEFSYSAASATCTSRTHRHHAYWRFDFDIDDSGNDVASEINPTAGTSSIISTETQTTWGNGTDGIYWDVVDQISGRGYNIVPSAADLLLPIDDFSKIDAAVSRYRATELDDGADSLGECAIRLDSGWNGTTPVINGEDTEGEDIVFWYRSSANHLANDPWACDLVGPTLSPKQVIPVELTSFDVLLNGNNTAELSWETSSETNNAGFEIEHAVERNGTWQSIGFVEGNGTTTEANSYSFTTSELTQDGLHRFRLKQVDFDGQFEYSNEIEISVEAPGSFVLESAYPNPFNPTTTVRFKVATAQNVTIALFDALGRQVANLHEGYAEAGRFESVRIDGSNLPSGTYTVRLEGDSVVGTTRVVLIK